MSNQSAPVATDGREQILAEISNQLQKLAHLDSPSNGADAHLLREKVRQYQNLTTARATAQEIKEIYEQLPWLQEVTFSFGFEYQAGDEGQYFRSAEVSVLSMTPELEHFGAQEFEDALVHPGSILDSSGESAIENLTEKDCFAYDGLNVYSLLNTQQDSESQHLSFTTTREAIEAAGDDIDALAAALFPESWAALAQELGLPYTPVDQPVAHDRPKA